MILGMLPIKNPAIPIMMDYRIYALKNMMVQTELVPNPYGFMIVLIGGDLRECLDGYQPRRKGLQYPGLQ